MIIWDEVERVMLRPWAWGETDCCTAACDVFRAVHGVDPMAALRGRYSTARQARALVMDRGGMGVMAGEMAALQGLQPCGSEAGAIGWTDAADWARWGALVVCPEDGVWVGKSASGFVAGVPVKGAWTWRN